MKKSIRKRGVARQPEISDQDDTRKAEASAGARSPPFEKKLRARLGIPYSFLTEKQWVKLEEISGLSHSARFEVNIALRRYWHRRMETAVNPDAIKRVLEAREALDAAVDAIIPLLDDEELYKGSIIHFQASATEQNLKLERCLETLTRAELMLARIQERLEKSKKRGNPGYGPLYELVHHLDYILYNFLGINVTRSKNRMPSPKAKGSSLDFVVTVLQIADLRVTSSTVDTIVRDYVKDRDQHGHNFDSSPRA